MKKTEARIKKVGNQWCVFSMDGTKNLGCSDTREGAIKRLGEVEHFKKVNSMNYESAFTNMAKALNIKSLNEKPSLENQLRQGTIAGIKSPRLLDRADHFPVITLDQAQSSLNRAFKLTEVPVWYNGKLDQLREEVYIGAVTNHPKLNNFNVKIPAEQAMALSDGQIPSETNTSDIKNPADVRSNEVKSVKRPTITTAEKLVLACQDPETRKVIANQLIDNLQKRQDSLKVAIKVANRLLEDGITSEEFEELISYTQEDILNQLLMSGVVANVTEAETRRQELLNRLGNKNG